MSLFDVTLFATAFATLTVIMDPIGTVPVFLGLTAYDTRKLSMMYDQAAGTELADRYSIYAALQLYLDFINIFLYLIRLLGYANRD